MLLALAVGFCFAYENAPVVKAEQPVLVTAFGQNPDTSILSILLNRNKVTHKVEVAAEPNKQDWTYYKAMIGVIGGSMKGLSQVSLTTEQELARCRDLMADARKAGAKVIGMHIGGADRMGEYSQAFLKLAAEVDFMIVKVADGTAEYFEPLCAQAGVPVYYVTKTSEITAVLGEIFN